ncbi:hypothetical protein C8Q70DRAFT_468031 [Cubamyces menziesii]|nr:hypothetical protein C8Q70DRAFT_468031 [Cubamyces menziesii]
MSILHARPPISLVFFIFLYPSLYRSVLRCSCVLIYKSSRSNMLLVPLCRLFDCSATGRSTLTSLRAHLMSSLWYNGLFFVLASCAYLWFTEDETVGVVRIAGKNGRPGGSARIRGRP